MLTTHESIAQSLHMASSSCQQMYHWLLKHIYTTTCFQYIQIQEQGRRRQRRDIKIRGRTANDDHTTQGETTNDTKQHKTSYDRTIRMLEKTRLCAAVRLWVIETLIELDDLLKWLGSGLRRRAHCSQPGSARLRWQAAPWRCWGPERMRCTSRRL